MCLVNWNVCESLENINIKAARLVQKLARVSELYYSEEKLSSVSQSVGQSVGFLTLRTAPQLTFSS